MITYPSKLYEILSSKYNLPIEVIRDVVVFSYREGLKRDIEALVKPEIYFKNLGSFKIKDYKLKYEIPTMDRVITDPKVDEGKREYYKFYVEALHRIAEELEFINQERKKFNESKKNVTRDLPEPKENMGRSKEQTIQK